MMTTKLTCSSCGATADLKNVRTVSGWIVTPRRKAACSNCVQRVVKENEAKEKAAKAMILMGEMQR